MSNCVGQTSPETLATSGPDLCLVMDQGGGGRGVEAVNEGADQVSTFLALLGQADSVLVDGQLPRNWGTADECGDEENEVVRFSWIDDEFLDFNVKLTEGGIAAGALVGGSFFCKDGEGDDVQVTLLRHVALVPAQSEVPA